MIFNIIHGAPARVPIFFGSPEPLPQSVSEGVRIRNRTSGPDCQKPSRMKRALVPRAHEHRHPSCGRLEHRVEATLLESTHVETPTYVGDRRQRV